MRNNKTSLEMIYSYSKNNKNRGGAYNI